MVVVDVCARAQAALLYTLVYALLVHALPCMLVYALPCALVYALLVYALLCVYQHLLPTRHHTKLYQSINQHVGGDGHTTVI